MSYHSSFRLAWPLRFAVLALIGALVSGCVAIPKNPLTAEQIKSLSIEEVTVITTPETVIWWGEADREFAASKGCEKATTEPQNDELGPAANPGNGCDYAALIESAEAKGFIAARAVDGLQQSLDQIVKPQFKGSDPVRLQVSLDRVTIVSAGQSLLVGGSHILMADFEIVDLASNQPRARYDDMFVTSGHAGGGLIAVIVEASTSTPPFNRLTTAYANRLASWLRAELN